jgi:Uma2 family endonuclease
MPVALETLPGSVNPPHKRWTRDECAVLEKARLIDLDRYELIEGELVLKMGKSQSHMRALMLLIAWLRSVFGETFVAQEPSIDLRPEDNPSSEPEPDAIVLTRSFLDLTSQARPDELRLVAEVSRTTLPFDLTTKARLYARADIPEYWVLDLEGRRLIVHRDPAEDGYRSVTAYSENEHVATLAAPSHEVRVGDLL